VPELPEVETVRKGLEKLVLNKTIESVEILWPRIIESPEVPIFSALLKGQRFERFERRGKFLIFKLTDYDLISHLRMEGKYEYFESERRSILNNQQIRSPQQKPTCCLKRSSMSWNAPLKQGGQPFGPISMHWAKQENSKCH